MELFSQSYFWYFLFAFETLYIVQKQYLDFKGSSAGIHNTMAAVSASGFLATIVFIVAGFWYMEQWWHPIVCLITVFVGSFVLTPLTAVVMCSPIGYMITGVLATILSPILFFFAFCSLFQ